LRSKTH